MSNHTPHQFFSSTSAPSIPEIVTALQVSHTADQIATILQENGLWPKRSDALLAARAVVESANLQKQLTGQFAEAIGRGVDACFRNCWPDVYAAYGRLRRVLGHPEQIPAGGISDAACRAQGGGCPKAIDYASLANDVFGFLGRTYGFGLVECDKIMRGVLHVRLAHVRRALEPVADRTEYLALLEERDRVTGSFRPHMTLAGVMVPLTIAKHTDGETLIVPDGTICPACGLATTWQLDCHGFQNEQYSAVCECDHAVKIDWSYR